MKRPRLPDRAPIAEDVLDLPKSRERRTRAPAVTEVKFTVTLPGQAWERLSDVAATRSRTTRKRVGILNVARDMLLEKLGAAK